MTPTPEPETRTSELQRFRRIMRYMLLVSLAVTIIAVAVVWRTDPDPSIHLLVATAILAGGSVLLGTFLMSLIFLSAHSGHDAAAAEHQKERNKE